MSFEGHSEADLDSYNDYDSGSYFTEREPITPLQKTIFKISSFMKKVIIDGETDIKVPSTEKSRSYRRKRVSNKIPDFIFTPQTEAEPKTIFSLHEKCALKLNFAEQDDDYRESVTDFLETSSNVSEGVSIASGNLPSENISVHSKKTETQSLQSSTDIELRKAASRISKHPKHDWSRYTGSNNFTNIIATKLSQKMKKCCEPEAIIERYHAIGSTLFPIRESEHHKDCHYTHFRALRNRMIRLIGSTTVRINDHAATQQLQHAIDLEEKQLAEEHEKQLAANERKRLQTLILRGVLETEDLKPKRKATAEDENLVDYHVTIMSQNQKRASRDFRTFTNNPTGGKYNALHLEPDHLRISSDFIDMELSPSAEFNKIPYGDKILRFINQTANQTRYFIRDAEKLVNRSVIEPVDIPAKKHRIPRRGFAESAVSYEEKEKFNEHQGMEELYDVANAYLEVPNYTEKWPPEMRQCFGELLSEEGVPHLEEYEGDLEDESSIFSDNSEEEVEIDDEVRLLNDDDLSILE